MKLLAPQHRVVLATDLSARSDRAMDRAASLMRRLDAELIALHVLELIDPIGPPPRRRPMAELVRIARAQLCDDLRDAGEQVTISIEERGDPADVILRVARERGCELIVTGVARNETFGRSTLGKTVDRLVRSSEIPLLIVTVRAPYQSIVVAVDFSEPSRHALETATALFPEERLTIVHAHDAPGSYAAVDFDRHRERFQHMAEVQLEAFLNEGSPVTKAVGMRSSARVEFGAPEQVMLELVQNSHVDLVVLGTHGRGYLLNAILGSTAKRILGSLPCDALVVPRRS
jgi:nucleotide-binding universal stress UspA family protein